MQDIPVKIIEMPQPLGIFAGELYDRALEYWEAFKLLSDEDIARSRYASYFLLAHSLELFLKSYLAAHDVSKKDLRSQKLRHDLAKIYTRCEALGIPADNNLRPFCYTLHEMNRDHDFRYPSGYNLYVPPLQFCRDVMEELQEKISPVITEKRMDAQLNFAASTRHLRGKKIRWSD